MAVCLKLQTLLRANGTTVSRIWGPFLCEAWLRYSFPPMREENGFSGYQSLLSIATLLHTFLRCSSVLSETTTHLIFEIALGDPWIQIPNIHSRYHGLDHAALCELSQNRTVKEETTERGAGTEYWPLPGSLAPVFCAHRKP